MGPLAQRSPPLSRLLFGPCPASGPVMATGPSEMSLDTRLTPPCLRVSRGQRETAENGKPSLLTESAPLSVSVKLLQNAPPTRAAGVWPVSDLQGPQLWLQHLPGAGLPAPLAVDTPRCPGPLRPPGLSQGVLSAWKMPSSFSLADSAHCLALASSSLPGQLFRHPEYLPVPQPLHCSLEHLEPIIRPPKRASSRGV